MNLELGVIPVKYVLMAKRLNMWHYILNEDIRSTIHQVYLALKCESRKGDFYSFIQNDLKDLNIQLEEASIRNMAKTQLKVFIKSVVKDGAFQHLVYENSKLEKTKDIVFEELNTIEYLLKTRAQLSLKLFFCLRSKA